MASLADATVESKAFLALYNKILVGIKSGLTDVVNESFSRELVPPSVKTKASNSSQSEDDRAGLLLGAIQNKIQNVPESYDKFADVLESIVSFGYLGKEMREKKAELLKQVENMPMLLEPSKESIPQLLSYRQLEERNDTDPEILVLSPLAEQDSQCNSSDQVKQVQPLEEVNKFTESQLLTLKRKYFCSGSCYTVIAVLILAMISFAIIEICFGIRILLGLDHCQREVINDLNGSYNILFGSTLFLVAAIIVPIFCLFSTCQHFGNSVKRKWRVVLYLGYLFLIFAILLSLATLIYSIFVGTTIYGSTASFSNNLVGNCSDSHFYSTLASLVSTHIIIGVLVVSFVIYSIVWCCCKHTRRLE